MPKVDKRHDGQPDRPIARDARSRYEISEEFIGEVRDSTLPQEIVRLLERRAQRSNGARLPSRPRAA